MPFYFQAYYLPETEYLHWVRGHPVKAYICNSKIYHCNFSNQMLGLIFFLLWIFTCAIMQEYTKGQVTSLINLVASCHKWTRKSRVEILEKIEAGEF